MATLRLLDRRIGSVQFAAMSRTQRSANQLTMFDNPSLQSALSDEADAAYAPAPAVSKGPPATREEIHEAMLETLAMLRDCAVNPWDARKVQYHVGLFRLRAEWFSPEVSEPLRAAFAAEAARLDFANAPEPLDDW